MLAGVLHLRIGVSRDPNNLQAFHRAHRLVADVYRLTESLPAAERFGLAGQLRRAATSVPTNIVEGCSRSSPREYQRFIDIALASACEVQYLLSLAVELRLLAATNLAECQDCSNHVIRELQNLRKAIGRFPT